MIPLLLLGESVALESAVEGPALAPLAAEPLSLRLGGDEVHLVFRAHLVLTSVLAGQGSEVNLLVAKSESSGSLLVKFGSDGEASSGCALRLCWSGLIVRGSGFIMLHPGSILLHCSSMASVLKITLKCVFSEGVMVRVLGSDLSFLFTWMPEKKAYKHKFPNIATAWKFKSHPGGLWELSPAPAHVGLGSENGVFRFHQLRVAVWWHVLRHVNAVNRSA